MGIWGNILFSRVDLQYDSPDDDDRLEEWDWQISCLGNLGLDGHVVHPSTVVELLPVSLRIRFMGAIIRASIQQYQHIIVFCIALFTTLLC